MISALTRNINRSISAKLRWSFGLILLLTLIGGSISIFALYQLNTLVQHTLSVQNNLVRNVGDLLNECRIIRFHERDFALQARTLGLEQARAQPYARWNAGIKQMGETINLLYKASNDLANPAFGQEQIELIQDEYQNYINQSESLFLLYDQRGDNVQGALSEWVNGSLLVDQLIDQNPAVVQANTQFNEQLMTLRSKHLSYLTTEHDAIAIYIQELYEGLEAITPGPLQDALNREANAFDQFYETTTNLRSAQTQVEAASTELEQILISRRTQLILDFDQASERLNSEYQFYITVIFISILVALSMGYLMARILSNQLIKPVLMLADAANKITSGRQGVRATILSKDEVGLAAKAFNKMASQLDELLFNLEVRVGQRTSQLETAAKVAAEASALRELESLLSSTTNLLTEQFENIYHAQIFLINKQGAGEWAVLRTSTGEAGQQLLDRHHRLRVGSRSVIGQVTQTGQHIIARPDDTDTVHQPNDILPETACELALPMKREGRVMGVLDVQSRIKDGFNEDDVVVLQILADQLTIAVENARLFDDLDSTIMETDLLFQASRNITTAKDQVGILDALTSVVESIDQIDRFSILFFDEFDSDGHPIGARSRRTWTRKEGIVEQTNRFQVASVINEIWSALKSGFLEVPDITEYASLDDRLYQVFQAFGTQSFAVVPLEAADNYLGVMLLQRQVPGKLPDSITRIFTLLAKQAAIALNRFGLLEEYQKQVIELKHLRRSFLQLSSSSDINQLWQALSVATTTLVNAEGAMVYAYNKVQDTMHLVASHNFGQKDLVGTRLARGEDAAGLLIIEDKEPKAFSISNYMRWAHRSGQLSLQAGSLVAIPLVLQGQLLGAITALNLPHQRIFDKNDERRLTLLADQAALTIDNIRLLEGSQQATKQLTTASVVSHAASSQLDVNQVLNQAVNLIKEQFGYYHVQVFLLDDESKWAYLRASTGEVGKTLLAKKHRLQVGSHSVIGQVSILARYLIARSAKMDPDTIHLPNELLEETQIELALPMKIGQRVIGALDIQSADSFSFDAEDIKLFQTLANQLAVAVEHARLFEDLRERTKRLDAANVLASKLLTVTSLNELTDLAVEDIAALMKVEQAGVVLFSDELNVGQVVAQYKSDGQPPALGAQFSLINDPLVEWLKSNQRPLAVSDIENEPLLAPQLSMLQQQGIGSILLIPLFVRGQLIGSIGIDVLNEPRNWSDIDVSLAQTLSNLVSSAIDRTHLFDQIRRTLEQTQTLYYASRAINQTKSKDRIAEAIAHYVVHTSGASVALISLQLDANNLIKEAHIEGSYLPFRKSNSTDRINPENESYDYAIDDRPSASGLIVAPKWNDTRLSDSILQLIRRLNPTESSILVSDVKESDLLTKKEARFLSLLGIGALISVPITLPNWRGLVVVTYADPYPLTPGHADRLAAISTQAATTMQNRELLIQTQASLQESQNLYQASVLLGESHDLEGLLNAILPLAKSIKPSQIVLLLFDEPVREGQRPIRFTVKSELTLDKPLLPVGESYQVWSFPLFKHQPVHLPLICENVETSELLEADERALLSQLGLQALLYLPLRIGARYIGWVGFNASEPRMMEDSTVRSLQTIAQQVAIGLHNQQLLAEAQRRAWQEEQISHITTRLHSTTDPNEIIRIGLQELKRTLHVKRAGVWFQQDNGSSE